jgi:type I restriction enzyme S subunit
MTGAVGQKRVPIAFIANSPIPLPPLNEQKRIVAKIEELFSELNAGEESLRRARRQLGTYRQSLLKQAFEGKLTAPWREENSHLLESSDVTPVGPLERLPPQWRSINLKSVIENPTYGTAKKCTYEIAGVGVLRIPNVVNGAIDSTDLKSAEFTDDEIASYALKAGDLLMIRSNGSVSIVGRCALVKSKHTEFLFAGYLIRLRPIKALIDPEFLRYQLSSLMLRSQIEFSAKSTSGVNNINSKEIQRLLIALAPLHEQQEIVRLLDEQFAVIEQNEREIDTSLKRSEALRQSILKKAFSGLLVPQDATDEPAAQLLERIKLGGYKLPQKKIEVAAVIKKSPHTASMKTLIEIMRTQAGWITAQKAFELSGIGHGSSTDEVEAIYTQLRDNIAEIEVERRGDEDWLKLKGGQNAN